MGSMQKWDARYGAHDYVTPREPAPFLVERCADLVPGRALCLAAGSGRNAVFLASIGFEVTAVDISSVGLGRCEKLAAERQVQVELVVADLQEYEMGHEEYDLICIIHYHNPLLFPRVREAVKQGGHVLFQTFSIDHVGRDWGPRDPVHLARGADLLVAFASWRTRFFEDGEVQHPDQGEGRSAAMVRLFAQKGEIAR